MATANNQAVVQQLAPTSVDVPIVFGLNTVMFVVLGFLGKWAFGQVVRGWESNFSRLEKEIQSLQDSQSTMCDIYVRQSDFVRTTVSIDNKLNAIAQRQDEQFHMLLDKLDRK
jgi:hypothetical protein